MGIGSEPARRLLEQVPGLTGVVGTTTGRTASRTSCRCGTAGDGAAVQVWTLGSRIWVNNLRRDPRVGFSLQEEPFPAVRWSSRAARRW